MASSIVRIVYLVAASNAGSDILRKSCSSSDLNSPHTQIRANALSAKGSQGYLGLWASIEVNLGVVVAACMPAMQPLLHPIYEFLGVNRIRALNGSRTGGKWPWAGRVVENDAPGPSANPAPRGFLRLDDSERLDGREYLATVSDAGYIGIGISKVTNHSYGRDGGGDSKDAIPLDAIHVKKELSISDARQV